MSDNVVDIKYKYYLHDLGCLIKERALNAKSKKEQEKKGSEGYFYQSGRLMGFNEVISILQQQASGFDIPLSEIQLADINPDKDLL